MEAGKSEGLTLPPVVVVDSMAETHKLKGQPVAVERVLLRRIW